VRFQQGLVVGHRLVGLELVVQRHQLHRPAQHTALAVGLVEGELRAAIEHQDLLAQRAREHAALAQQDLARARRRGEGRAAQAQHASQSDRAYTVKCTTLHVMSPARVRRDTWFRQIGSKRAGRDNRDPWKSSRS
jgi:hypothetical protein